ncbi:protein cortex isoform X2 [Bombyx mori]|uniref:Protein cortex n=1 Tax=Bombyx mori TaxID=7091 RepID=A0A8R2AHS4_BOMMO|nr:protein cortex isoform X2 [Bombyx mori]
MNRTAFGKKSLNRRRPRVDRFVLPREQLAEIKSRALWKIPSAYTGDIWSSEYLQRKKYAEYLDEAFGLEPLKAHDCNQSIPDGYRAQAWPCVPRKRRYLTSADSILDLPTYSYALFPELLDWSSDNILVAALGRNYHKWSWRTQSLTNQGFTQYEIQCCKFDPRGELLLLGTDNQITEIHNNAMSKWVAECSCLCNRFVAICSITAVDWSPTGNSFITGCSRGVLVSYTRTGDMLGWRRVGETMLAVRVSPDARYVAAAAVNGTTVLVMTWPLLHLYSSLGSNWTVKALSWHPWRSALLGVGAVTSRMNAHVAVWDAPTSRVTDTTIRHSRHSLDAMLFSHKTGELVISLWNPERAVSSPKTCSQLVVMSGPDKVVDQWGEERSGLDRIRTMVFSPDGTKLATATADEDLIIWNFLPEDSKRKKWKCDRFWALPLYLDETTYGLSMR